MAGEAGRCALCGTPDLRQLCRDCRLAHSVAGVVPPWLAELQRLAQLVTKRERRNALRVVRGVRANPPGRGGARYAAGIALVSLDELAERRERRRRARVA